MSDREEIAEYARGLHCEVERIAKQRDRYREALEQIEKRIRFRQDYPGDIHHIVRTALEGESDE